MRYRAETLLGLRDELDGAGVHPAGWKGEGATAAARRRETISQQLRRTVAGVEAVRTAVWAAGGAVVSVQQALRETDELAVHFYFHVGDDNVVSDRDPGGLEENVAADRERMRTALPERVGQVLRAAEAADAELARVLTAADGDAIDDGTGAALVSAQTAGIVAGSPQAVPLPPAAANAYWDALTVSQRAQVLRSRPELIGNLDGIPAGVPNQANRARLPGELARVRAELAAVSVGDVDTADHVAVHVPGMTTTVQGSLDSKNGEMRDLGQQTENQLDRQGRGDETGAAVTWIGYEAPDRNSFVDDADLTDTVATDGIARDTAPVLAGLLNGVDASRTTDPNLTTLAHSYGSTTASYALQEDTGVDNAVF